MKSDPFNQNGLDNIPKNDYDKILIDTKGIRFAKSFRSNNGNFVVGENYMLAGNFGTGKTCVMDYIENYAYEIGLYPIKINVFASTSPLIMLTKFYRSLYRKVNQSKVTAIGDEGSCISEMDDILKQNQSLNGFIIMIDEYIRQ